MDKQTQREEDNAVWQSFLMPGPYGALGLFNAPYMFPMYSGMPLTPPVEEAEEK